MRTVETILIREGIKEKDGGGKSKIYCKHFCECHNVLPVKQYMIIKINK
jgi:hypothetical protein